MQSLSELVEQAESDIAGAVDLAALDAVRVRYLGKKGELTARLKGLSFWAVVLKHALRNALIAPFTVIMLQIPWLLTGVVIIEALFNYKGFGWTLVAAAGNNDIELLEHIETQEQVYSTLIRFFC